MVATPSFLSRRAPGWLVSSRTVRSTTPEAQGPGVLPAAEPAPLQPALPATFAGGSQRQMRRHRRRRRRPSPLLAGFLLLILLLAAGGAGARLAADSVEGGVTQRFRSGQAHLEHGRALLKKATTDHNAALVPPARAEFDRARANFRGAESDLQGNWIITNRDRIPRAPGYLDPRLRAVHSLSAMGIALSDAGTQAAAVDQMFLDPAAASKEEGTRRILSLLADAAGPLRAIHEDLDRARTEAASIDPALLGNSRPAFVQARASIDKGIAGIADFERLAPVLNEILAAGGRRTYVVEQLNPAELRPGGGYIGTYSILTADHGVLKVTASGDTHDLVDFPLRKGQRGYVPPPLTLTEFLEDHSWNFGDSNFFPSFPENALAAEQFAERDFGTRIDGVIGLDLYAVAGMLQLTGPIAVPGFDLTLDSKNLVTEVIRRDIEDPNHKALLGAVAGPLMQKVTELRSDQWPQLVTVLNTLATQRHLQTYFNNASAQDEIARYGWSGDLLATRAPDFIYPLEANYGGNKANYFLTRAYDVTLTHSGGLLHHRIVENLTLDASKAPPHYNPFYRAYYRLYAPADATGLRIGNVKPSNHRLTAAPGGSTVVDGWQQINPDRGGHGTLQVTFEYDSPWKPDGAGTHTVYWQKQPGIDRDAVTLHFSDGGRTYNATTNLTTDRVLHLSARGITVEEGHAATAKLPGLSV